MTARKKAVPVGRSAAKNAPGEWTALQFSLANPEGPGQELVPRLLNRLAAHIRSLGAVEILDITYQTEITADGARPSFTVYHRRPHRSGQRAFGRRLARDSRAKQVR